MLVFSIHKEVPKAKSRNIYGRINSKEIPFSGSNLDLFGSQKIDFFNDCWYEETKCGFANCRADWV